MGSSSSKFRKHLQNGDEYAALQLYYSSSDLRKGLDPNSSYGDTYSHDTPLHYAARHAMKSLLRVFLNELGGNPNKKNARNETALMCVCMVATTRLNYAIQQRRLECLSLVLQWRGGTLENGEVERVDITAQDEKLNTALHYAAASGLKRCVEFLVGQNAPMFTENFLKQTPCDCSEKSGHNEIALFLESKMVFHNEEENIEELDNLLDEMETEEGYSGLRAQDLQEAKDQLLVETSDMLHVPLFTAEALLRNHEWSREMLLEAWMTNAVTCCEKCGVVPPVTIFEQQPSTSCVTCPGVVHQIQIEHDLRTPTHNCPPTLDTICDICANVINPTEVPVPMLCDDRFCRQCWERYLSFKIQEGEAHNITCPGFECHKLVPAEIIETLVSRDMARRYLQFDIKAFVESNPSIKWCPYPGCGRAVRLPESDNPLSPTFRGLSDMDSPKDTSHSVDCGNGHMFCWECLGEAHEPSSCENWESWHSKIAEVKPEEMNGTEEETEMAANCLWLITNSKPCPNCKSPIQKNEGCNHMKCSKCKHDFCWVCQEVWKKHSSATGGYFRCNRYEAVKRVEDNQDNMKSQAESKNQRMQELNRFVHYYTRFKNHENSFKLEEPLLNTAKDKMMVLAKAVTDPETANLETKFVEDAVVQILKARRVLKCSYVYGFYLDDSGYKKPIFEFMQTELEECTETLSEMVARPYLRTPRTKIIQTAHLVQRKRQEFVTAIAKGLVPPDSPSMKRKRKKFNVEVDDDLRQALLASMHDLDPANPWIKDPSGKHTNVSALLDWPEESDSDGEPSPVPVRRRGPAKVQPLVCVDNFLEQPADSNQHAMGLEVAEIPAEPCQREGCSKPRVINPRTGVLHQHCCMKCMRLDGMENAEGSKSEATCEFFSDYQMDLLRALEMSRLQFMQEMGSLRPGTGDRSPIPSSSRPTSVDCTLDKSPTAPSRRSPCVSISQIACDPLLPSIILCDPPPGKNRPIRGLEALESAMIDQDETKANALLGDIDRELERALRISHISVQDDDHDLRLAIELSLCDSTPSGSATGIGSAASLSHQSQCDPVATASGPSQHDSEASTTRITEAEDQNALSTEYSSIVTRVPNKSIEDLAVENPPLPYSSRCENSLLQASVAASDTVSMPSPQHDSLHTNQPFYTQQQLHTTQGLRYHFLDAVPCKDQGYPSNQTDSLTVQPNSFGIIKDISVHNIIASDTDKIKGFSDKDLSQVFDKKNTCDASIEAVVFEPHPTPSSIKHSRWQTSYPGHHCSKQADYKFDSGEDPWLRQTDKQNQCRATFPEFSSGNTTGNDWISACPIDQCPTSSRDSPAQLQISSITCSPNTRLRPRSPNSLSQPTSQQRNPEESLEHALQNLNDLTRNLTRDDSLDSVDMVIDSKVLESLLQGAEGYAKVLDANEANAKECDAKQRRAKEYDANESHAKECVGNKEGASFVDGNNQPSRFGFTDLDLEHILETAPHVPPNADLDCLPAPSTYEHTQLVVRHSHSEPADEKESERDAVYV